MWQCPKARINARNVLPSRRLWDLEAEEEMELSMLLCQRAVARCRWDKIRQPESRLRHAGYFH